MNKRETVRRTILGIAAAVLVVSIWPNISVHAATKQTAKPAVKVGAVCPQPAPKRIVSKPGTVAGKTGAKKNAPKAKTPKALPRLLDLGATKCIPCKMMVPVLDELAKEYKGKLKVEFIDVWKNQSAGQKYKVQTIPTQIFFDAKGKEVYRHVGYFPKNDILKAFKDHGIKLSR